MIKKRIAIIIILLLLLNSVRSQQRPHYTQYILNNFIVNPAMAGIENYTDVKLSHRTQWVGLDGAPVTTYFTMHAPLKKSAYDVETSTSIHRDGFNPRGQAYWQEYKAPDNHAGIGFTILNDRTGPLNNFTATATYAYHLGIGPHTALSAGVSAGVTNLRLDASKLQFNIPTDPIISGSGYLNNFRPDLCLGLWLYDRDFYIGLTANQIVPQKIIYNQNRVELAQGKLVPHLSLSTGFRFFLNEDISFLPSTTIRYINPFPISFDINTKFQYQDLAWLGCSYRLNDGYAAMLGININSTFNIGYSFDFISSQLNAVTKGSHEILIGFLLGNKYGDWCPRNF